MVSIETEAILVATVLSIFIGILPLSYMNWQEKHLQRFQRKMEGIATVGAYMDGVGARSIHLSGPFRVWNVKLEVDIQSDSAYKKSIDEFFGKHGGEFVRIAPRNTNERVMQGLNELAALTFRRGYRTFMRLLFIMSFTLVFSVISILVELPSWVGVDALLASLLLVSVSCFLIYSREVFSDGDCSWFFTWTEGTKVYLVNDRMWDGIV